MRKIAVFTGTRADYGILYWLITELKLASDFQLQLIVAGTHLSPMHGNTYRQIEADGFVIDRKVEMLLSGDSDSSTAKSTGLAILGFTDALSQLKPDLIVILGDRYEALAMAQTAMLMKVPIAHIHGGEISQGALDDCMRHAITKLSTLHFTSTPQYRSRVIQLGESPDRVHWVGSLGIEHLDRSTLMTLPQLSDSLGFSLVQPFLLVTYHPVTLNDECPSLAIKALINALDLYPQYQIILTYPNADNGGQSIINILKKYQERQSSRVLLIESLGQVRYLSAVKHAAAVIGNSSSGIIEVPALSTPTINIGQRQNGRLAGPSVFHCSADSMEVSHAIATVTSKDFVGYLDPSKNPYGSGFVSTKIIKVFRQFDYSPLKTFFDLNPPQE